jgi:hypothetical protein
MSFTIIYKGDVYGIELMLPDGSGALEGWLEYEPEIPWLAYQVDYPKGHPSGNVSEQHEVYLPAESDCPKGTCKNPARRLSFSAEAPDELFRVKVDGDKLFLQGKPLSDYLRNIKID